LHPFFADFYRDKIYISTLFVLERIILIKKIKSYEYKFCFAKEKVI